jgi:hypothetical protein
LGTLPNSIVVAQCNMTDDLRQNAVDQQERQGRVTPGMSIYWFHR